MSEDTNITQLIVTILTGTIIPMVVLWLQKVSWPSYYKFGLAGALSIIAATLMSYNEGKLTPASMADNFVTIFTVSQTVYYTFFRALNLHKFLYPQDALANKTKDEVTKSIETGVSHEEAKNILDDNKPDQLSVSMEVTEAQG
jgi:hypothetical protein